MPVAASTTKLWTKRCPYERRSQHWEAKPCEVQKLDPALVSPNLPHGECNKDEKRERGGTEHLSVLLSKIAVVMGCGLLVTSAMQGSVNRWGGYQAGRMAFSAGLFLVSLTCVMAMEGAKEGTNPFAWMAAGATVGMLHRSWRPEHGIPLDQIPENCFCKAILILSIFHPE